MSSLINKIQGISSDFEAMFFRNEYRSLIGTNLRTILALTGIMFLTFIALGFAVGGLENLDKRMNNPFTNWVNVDVNNQISTVGGKVRDRYSQPEVKDSFLLKNTNGFTRYVLNFYEKSFDPFQHPQDTLSRDLKGRSIEPDEVLLGSILSAENVIWRDKAADSSNINECDIIVSSALLTSRGFNIPAEEESEFYLPIYDNGNLIFLKVHAVVRELPGLFNRFVAFPKLHNILKAIEIDGKACKDLVVANSDKNNTFLLLTDDTGNVPKIEALAKDFFKTTPFVDIEQTYRTEQWEAKGIRMSFPPAEAPDLKLVKQFIAVAQKSIRLCEFAYIDCGADICRSLDEGDFNYLAFHFDMLEHIRSFRKDLSERFDIEMDVTQVEAKENFWLVTRLTLIISLILLSFGILSIVSFVNNMIKNHLFGIRSNLGTFQAFGLDNGFLVKIYLKIVLSFIIISILISFGLAVFVDRVENLIRPDDSLFNIFSPWILAAIVGLIIVSLVLTIFTIRRILNDTPGNLIYER